MSAANPDVRTDATHRRHRRIVVVVSAAAAGYALLGVALLANRSADTRVIVADMDERIWWWNGLATVVVLCGIGGIALAASLARLLPIADALRRIAAGAALGAAAVPAVLVLWLLATGPLLDLEGVAAPQEYRTVEAEGRTAVVREVPQTDGTVLLAAGERHGLLVRFGRASRVAVDPRYGLDAWHLDLDQDAVRWTTPRGGATGSVPVGAAS